MTDPATVESLARTMLRVGHERAERGPSAKDVVRLAVERRRATCVRQGQMRLRELEPSLHREPGQSMRQQRACPLRSSRASSGLARLAPWRLRALP